MSFPISLAMDSAAPWGIFPSLQWKTLQNLCSREQVEVAPQLPTYTALCQPCSGAAHLHAQVAAGSILACRAVGVPVGSAQGPEKIPSLQSDLVKGKKKSIKKKSACCCLMNKWNPSSTRPRLRLHPCTVLPSLSGTDSTARPRSGGRGRTSPPRYRRYRRAGPRGSAPLGPRRLAAGRGRRAPIG